MIGSDGIVATRGSVVLRQARDEDLPRVDEITIICYAAIQASFVAMLGEECYERVRHNPELNWEERKIRQNRRLFAEHPDRVWVLEEHAQVFGFVTFYLFPEQGYGHIDNNGVHPDHAGIGWGKFMYQHVLQHFRTRACAMRMWTPASTPLISRPDVRTRQSASIARCPS